MTGRNKNKTKTIILHPNKGVSIANSNVFFKLGSNIRRYQPMKYDLSHSDKSDSFNTSFYELFDYPIEIWTNNEKKAGTIETIRCEKTCVWNGIELIGMLYDDFITQFHLIHDCYDKVYSYGPKRNGREYEVYDFYNYGLSIWVWRKRIRDILVSDYTEAIKEDEMNGNK